MNDKSLAVIIVAGGTGLRMGTDVPKQFLEINQKEIIEYTIEAFVESKVADKIYIVCHKDYVEHVRSIMESASHSVSFEVVTGGSDRQKSVYNGLVRAKEHKYVMIHDAVRCCITKKEILDVYDMLINSGACALGVKVKDTIKIVDSSDEIVETPDRRYLVQIQTPQAFETKDIINAHESAAKLGILATDDCALVETMGQKIKVVYGSYDNIKITTPEDIIVAKEILKRQ